MSCLGASRQLDSESVVEVYGKWQPPSKEQAEQKYHASHLQHDTFELATAKVSDFKEFGAGHLIYFYFLRHMAVVFGILAAVPALPLLIFNLGGQFLDTGALNFEATTLGNFGMPSSNSNISTLPISLPSTNKGADAELVLVAYFQSQADQPAVTMSSIHANKLNALIAGSVLDLFGILFFFASCFLLAIRTKDMSRNVLEQVTSLKDYSLAVSNLPPDTTPEELQKWFEPYGEVVQVECARKCNMLIRLVQERRQVLDELDTATATLQRSAQLAPRVDESLEIEVLNLKYDLSLLTEAIKASQKAQAGNDVVRGYVTFNTDQGRNAALAAQLKGLVARWRAQPGHKFRSLHLLWVQVAPEATDIYFENIEFTARYRFLARSLTFLFKVLLVLAGFVLVSTAPSIKRNVAGGNGPSESECDASCTWRNSLNQLFLNDTMRGVYKTCYETGTYANAVSCQSATICYECFCRSALMASMYEEASYCDAFQNVLLQATGAQALTVFSIIIINFVIKKLIAWLTSEEKHRTRTRESLSMMSALFTAQFVNTAFSILIANMYLPSLQAKLSPTLQRVLFGGVYSDTSPNWYREVGKAILISQLISIPVRAALVGINILKVHWRRKRSYKALTQAQLDRAYQGHSFELADRYGELLAVIFVGLCYSSTMPLLYWTLALSFVVAYHLEKYELLRVCKWPISYGSHLGERVARILPWAAVVHLLGAVWMVSTIGAPRSPLFGDSWAYSIMDGLSSALRSLWDNTTELSSDQMAARLTNKAVGHLVWALVLITIGLVVYYSWPTWREMYIAARLKAKKAAEERRQQAELAAQEKLAAEQQQEEDDPDDPYALMARDADPSSPQLAKAKQALPPVEGPLPPAPGGGELGPDEGGHGVPEFTLAVRSKLLVGPQSYELRTNPNYAYAFERLEDVLLNETDMDRVEQEEREAQAAWMAPNARLIRRRQRREAAREALQAQPEQANGHFAQRLRTQEREALMRQQGGAAAAATTTPSRSNQVAPWKGADQEGGGVVEHTAVQAFDGGGKGAGSGTRQPASLPGDAAAPQYRTDLAHMAMAQHSGQGDQAARPHGARKGA